MKKTYVAPVAEKINFEYKDQVVAASRNCTNLWVKEGTVEVKCQDQEFVMNYID